MDELNEVNYNASSIKEMNMDLDYVIDNSINIMDHRNSANTSKQSF